LFKNVIDMNKINTDIFLISAPNRNLDYPGLSLPSLYGSIKNKFRVEQRDLNVTVRDALFSYKVLSCIKNNVLPELIYNFSSHHEIVRYFAKLYNYLSSIDLKNLERIKVLMQKRNYDEIITNKDGSDGIQSVFKLNRTMHLFIEFYASHENIISKIFIRTIGYDPIALVLDNLLSEIVSSGTVVVGFTCLEIQRNFTLMLIKKIKKAHYENISFNGYIVLGGADPTRYKENYLKYFKDIDFVFMYEGEENFTELSNKLLLGEKDFWNIKNIVYRDGTSIRSTYDSRYTLPAHKIVSPNFTGFELNKYLVPALPVHASRACYYALEKKHNCKVCTKYNISCSGSKDLCGCEQEENGCNFCIHYKTYSNYVERNAKAVVDDMQSLYEKHGIILFHLTDDSLKPILGTAISDEIIRRGLTNIRWLVYARFEPEFDYNTLKKWFDAGCRVIEWGLESASQKVIDNMNKNIRMDDVRRILKISSNIGILNKLFLFHNHPSETVTDLQETLDFLLDLSQKNQIRLFPVVRNKMFLLKGSMLYKNWKHFYLKVWEPSSIFSMTAEYLEKEPYQEKVRIVEQFVKKIRDIMKTKGVYSTDDENVMFDLLTIQMVESQNITYYKCK